MSKVPTQDSKAPEHSPSPRWLVIPLLVCMVVPGVLGAMSALRSAWRDDAASDGLNLEERLEEASPWIHWAQDFYAPEVDSLLERGNRRVVLGHDKWSFYRPAVDYVTGPPLGSVGTGEARDGDDFGDPAAVILDFHRQLQARGVELVVMPVPVKATLHPEKLWPTADPWALPNNAGFAQLVDRLRGAGVDVFDVAPALLEAKREGIPPFLPRDTHWTPEGMVVAARSLAEHVRQLPVWQTLKDDVESFDHRLVTFTGRGDIYDMLAYAKAERNLRPMRFVVNQVIATPGGDRPISNDGTVLLLGDSLTNVFSSESLEMGRRGGFGENLAAQLGLPVDVIASPGGGASRSRQALALRSQPLAGKRLVIWQFTQRDLVAAAGGWQVVALPDTTATATVDAETAPRFEVLAWLRETTKVPRNLDYGDCLIAARFRRADGRLPGVEGDFEVLVWGVRDWQPTAAASLSSERLYRLTLQPLPPEIDLESTCWLDTVGLKAKPWWAVTVEVE